VCADKTDVNIQISGCMQCAVLIELYKPVKIFQKNHCTKLNTADNLTVMSVTI